MIVVADQAGLFDFVWPFESDVALLIAVFALESRVRTLLNKRKKLGVLVNESQLNRLLRRWRFFLA